MTGFPINPPNAPLGFFSDQQGRKVWVNVDPAWYRFFLAIQKIIGGPSDPFDDNGLLSALPRAPVEAGNNTLSPPPMITVTFDDRLEPYGAQRDAFLDADKQPRDPTLTALAAYNTTGLLTQTAADTFVGRSIAVGSAKLTITNPAGTAGDPTLDFGSVASTDLSDTADLARLAGATFTGAVDVQALLRCNSFRIDQTPTAEAVVCTHTLTISADGTDYKIPIVAA